MPSFAIDVAWSVALAPLTLWLLIMAGVFCDNFQQCYFPRPLAGFVGIRLGCGDLQPRALLKGANRVGEADRTELVQFQQKSGESGEGSLPPGEWRWR